MQEEWKQARTASDNGIETFPEIFFMIMKGLRVHLTQKKFV